MDYYEKALFLVLLLVIVRVTCAQEAYLWPIKDAKPGTNIISAWDISTRN